MEGGGKEGMRKRKITTLGDKYWGVNNEVGSRGMNFFGYSNPKVKKMNTSLTQIIPPDSHVSPVH